MRFKYVKGLLQLRLLIERRLSYLINVIKVSFHALNRHILVGFRGLGLQNFGEGTFALLADQSILYTN